MSMLDESDLNGSSDLTDAIIIDTVRTLVLKQDAHASFITVSEEESALNGVVCYNAKYLAFNGNISKLSVLLDTVTFDVVASFLSICKFPNGGF
jgi:hypothetical protein